MQVWLGRKLLGRLETAVPVENNRARWYLTARGPSATPSESQISLNRSIEIPVFKRSCELTMMEFVRLGNNFAVERKLVDDFRCDLDDCETYDSLVTDKRTWSWPVLHPMTTDEVEFLFDMPEFVPA